MPGPQASGPQQSARTPGRTERTKWKTVELAGRGSQAGGAGWRGPGRGCGRRLQRAWGTSPGLSTMWGRGWRRSRPGWVVATGVRCRRGAAPAPQRGVDGRRVQESCIVSLGRGPRLGCGAGWGWGRGRGLVRGLRGAVAQGPGLLGRGCSPCVLRSGRFLRLLRGPGGPDWFLACRLGRRRGIWALWRRWTVRGSWCPLGLR